MEKFFLIKKDCCGDSASGEEVLIDGCCINTWKNDLKNTTNLYNTKNAITTLNYQNYIKALNWEEQLKVWKVNIDVTNQKSNEVLNAITFFKSKVDKVCENSNNTTKSIKKLALLLKRIFDEFYTYEAAKKGIFDYMYEIICDIEAYEHCDKDDKKEASGFVLALQNLLKSITESQNAILESALNTLKASFHLTDAICGAQGLKAKLAAMLTYFNDQSVTKELEANQTISQFPKKEAVTPPPNSTSNADNADKPDKPKDFNVYPCTDKPTRTIPTFPLSKNKYYTDLETELRAAQGKTTQLESDWKTAKANSDQLLSKKEGLIEAIKAAELAGSIK